MEVGEEMQQLQKEEKEQGLLLAVKRISYEGDTFGSWSSRLSRVYSREHECPRWGVPPVCTE